jgi:hypothetical protein
MSSLLRHQSPNRHGIVQGLNHTCFPVLLAMQQESIKRTALEQRLYSNILEQSETMVAMELKLLRLEAKLERREGMQTNNRENDTSSRMSPPFEPRGIRAIMESQTTLLDHPQVRRVGSDNVAFVSSANSLASGVTAESFVADGEDADRQEEGIHSNDRNEIGSQTSSK